MNRSGHLTLLCIACFLATVPARAQYLDAGAHFERQLADDEVHTHSIVLAPDQFLDVTVDQNGIDLAVTLYDPAGDILLEVDSPNGPDGPEELAAVATTPGEHRLVIKAPGGGSGRYELTVRALRPATEIDRRLAKAMHLYAHSEKPRRALELLSGLDAPRLRARILRHLGRLSSDAGNVGEALDHFRRAEPLIRAHSNGWELLPLLNDAGRVYRLVGEPQEARRRLFEAVDLGERLGHRSGKAIALNNLGLLHHSLGEYQPALDFYHRSLSERQEAKLRQGTVLQNLGMIYSALGRMAEGRDFLGRALAEHQARGRLEGQAEVFAGLGWIEEAEGSPDEALTAYRRALALHRQLGDRQGEAVMLDLCGRLYAEIGRGHEAGQALEAALEIFREIGSRTDEAHTLIHAGRWQLARGETQTALTHHRGALAIFREVGNLHGEAASLVGMAEIERTRGRWADCREHFERALEITESVRAGLQSGGLRGSFLATRIDHYGAYIDLLMDLDRRQPGHGHAERAFEISERARARSLLDRLGHGSAERSLQTVSNRAIRKQLSRKIRAKEIRRMEVAADGDERRAAILEKEIRTLLLDYERMGAEKSGTSEPLSLKAIREEVLGDNAHDKETVLLAYRLGPDRSFLWVVGHELFEAHELPPADEIDGLARQVHELLPRSHERGLRLQSRLALEELGRQLLGPVTGGLSAQRLAILADGALQAIPFAALPIPGRDEPSPPQPLLAKYEVVHLPSASVAASLRRGRSPSPTSDKWLAMIADPVFQPGDSRLGADPETTAPIVLRGDVQRSAKAVGLDRFERLVYSREEALAVLDLAPAGTSTFQALDLRANRDVVLGGELSGYRIVHFATHGVLNARHPELSGIVLSLVDADGRPKDGMLWAHEVADLGLTADLVVLSACRTALGKEVRGEGVLGLTRSFFDTGVPRVVVSHWSVDDRATAELMQRFYRAMLRDDQRPAAALRSAQLSMLDEPAWQLPYFWAGFALHGDWR